MKICYAFLLCCLCVMASPSVSFGEDVLHTFTTPDGRSLNAVIKGHNERTGKIQIKREDGKELWTLPTVFSEPDQEYIRLWIAANQFMSSTKFKIKGDSDKDTISKKKTIIEYEITLENKTDFPLKDLRIEYRAFIFNQGYEGRKDSNQVEGGQLYITEIPAKEKVTRKIPDLILTSGFRLVHETSGWSGSTTTYEQKTNQKHLKGFWVRVYGPEIDGKPTLREWCNPPDTFEDFAWQETISPSHRKLTSAENPNPAKDIERLIQQYNKKTSTRTAQQIGHAYIWRLKPPNIPLGLEWFEKAAKENNVAACRGLALIYSGFYGHPKYYNLEKTLKYGQQALSIEPDCHTAPQAMAKAYALDNQFDKAVKYQSQAIESYKKNTRGNPSSEHLSRMEAALELYRNNKTE